MARSCLEALPEASLPSAYSLRTFQAGDEAAWCRLVNESIGGEYTPESMRTSLLSQPCFDRQDLFFAEKDGVVVGTACAQRERVARERIGLVHMLAVDPKHRGIGLGRALLAATLRRLKDVGYRSAALSTDDFRLAAIRLYLQFGFRPNLTHDSHAARWRQVFGRLGLAADDVTGARQNSG
jgi:mycothiol synthase